jgi:coenzyme Q-binding protein COQ10
MYEIVMDIEKYPEFLPWCRQAKIIEEISSHNLRADLLISFKGFLQKYRSDVKHGQNDCAAYFVDVVAIEGPFKKLINQWKFCHHGKKSCQVTFFVDFEFNSMLLTKVTGLIFSEASKKMMAAFEKRAQIITKKDF